MVGEYEHDQFLAPKVDVEVTDEQIRIEADLPGLDKKDIDVQLDGSQLTLSATRTSEESTEKESYVRRERSYGEYRRSFQLPEDVDADSLAASYKNGVLAITVNKIPARKPKSIKVS